MANEEDKVDGESGAIRTKKNTARFFVENRQIVSGLRRKINYHQPSSSYTMLLLV